MYKALGCFIFCGSQTLGWLKAGVNVDRILEMTDDMPKNNAYHFIKNHPEIPVVIPSEWENDTYLDSLKDIDILFANPPCSGLSSINRNASCATDGVNSNLFRYARIVEKVQPKVFLIENAPTLTKLGLPILKLLQNQLGSNYRFTIINDFAGNHSVPMQRRRTLVIGWRKDIFNGIPLIEQVKDNYYSIGDALKDISGENQNTVRYPIDFTRFYHNVRENQTILQYLNENYDSIKNQLNEKELHEVDNYRRRKLSKSNVWDKSSWRPKLNGQAPSLASVVKIMHPIEDRDLYIREYARLMGYPDDFVFYPDECQTPIIQCIAQGVPANFIYYIANQIINALDGKYQLDDCDVMYINQCTGTQHITKHTSKGFQECSNIDINEPVFKNESLF